MSYRKEGDPMKGRTAEQFHQEMNFHHAVRIDRATGRRPDFRSDTVGSIMEKPRLVYRTSGVPADKK